MKHLKRRAKWSRRGVSEIIANILILGITVTLFSSIMFYVASMPAPQENAYADFSSQVNIDKSVSPWQVHVNITHKGGQELKNSYTALYLEFNGKGRTLRISDSSPSIGSTWATGETWRWHNSSFDILFGEVPNPPSMSMMIVDTQRNTVVWSATLSGGAVGGGVRPIIGARGTTPTPSYAGDSLWFYVTVTDPDGDLNRDSVYVNLTSIGQSPAKVKLTDNNYDNVFTSDKFTANIGWDGKIVIFSATDLNGHTADGRLTLSILNRTGGGGGGGGGKGGPPGNLDYSGLQGFSIFEGQDWERNSYNATPTVLFTHGQNAIVVVASKYLVNLDNGNSILVMNPTSKAVFSIVSTPSNQFVRYEFNAGYYVYNCSIDIGLIPDNSQYLLQVQLRDSWVPNNIFFMNAIISVGNGFTPSFLTFSDPAFSQPSNSFRTTDKVYVEVRDQLGGAWNQYGGDVEIRDFFWNAMVKRQPASVAGASSDVKYNGPISNLWQVSGQPTVYRFVIALYNATSGSPWIPGSNSYVLRYDMFKATSETYLLSKVLNITAPKWKADIVIGGESGGNGRFATYSGLFYYKNDNQWSPPDVLESSPDKINAPPPNFYLLRIGDVDGDLKNDFVAVRDSGTSSYLLSVYFNHNGWVREDIAVLPLDKVGGGAKRVLPTELAVGNLGLGNDLDIVVAYSGEVNIQGTIRTNPVVAYHSDGLWTSTLVGTASGGVVSLKVADMDPAGTPGNDPLRSWDIVVGCNNGAVTIFKNNLGTGYSWTVTSTLGGTATVYDWAMDDINIMGRNTVGSYQQTMNPYQDDGIYEQLNEAFIYQVANIWPTNKGPMDNCSDFVEDLRWNAPSPYTVLPGQTANVNLWDSSNTSISYTPHSVFFTAKIRTYGGTYSANDPLQWWSQSGSTWTPHTILNVQDTGGSIVVVSINLTSFFTSPTDLAKLNITFHNSDLTAMVDFSWALNITYTIGDSLDHRWQLSLRSSASGAHAFSVYAVISPSSDGDTFKFQWSKDNATWSGGTLGGDLVSVSGTTLPMPSYSGTIPAGISGTIYVRVIDVKSGTLAPALDWIKVGQMTVITSATVSNIGTKVLDLDVKDMNGDGANDIAIITQGTGSNPPGKVWVGFNAPTGILSNLVQVVADDTRFSSVKDLAIGRYFGTDTNPNLGIMLATSSTVYFIRNNGGSFAVDTQTFVPVGGITKGLSADVDGDGWSDVLVITATNNIQLYSYYGTVFGWQTMAIDNLGGTCTIRDADVGVLQD